jgi:hypothetical protein
MVGITSEGTTTWSHLVAGEVAETGGTGLRYVPAGTAAEVVPAGSGPSAAYLTVTVPRTAAQIEAAQQAVTMGQAGTYSYLTNNCATYATSVLRASGVAAPASTPMASFVTTALQSPAVVQPVVAASVATNTGVGVYAGMQSDASSSSSSTSPINIGPDPSQQYTPAGSGNDDPAAQVCQGD